MPSDCGSTMPSDPPGAYVYGLSSGFSDKSANYGCSARDQARKRILEGRCRQPARYVRLRMSDGRLEPLPCGKSNRCDYCAYLATVETAVVLELDARICQPTVGITTTTRRPETSMLELRKAEAELWKALREGRRVGGPRGRRKNGDDVEAFPDLRYCAFLEFTTGQGTHAGGYRRPHLHHLVKGIPADNPLLSPVVLDDEAVAKSLGRNVGDTTTELEQRVSALWRVITGDAFVVECQPLRTSAGAVRYLFRHHRKKTQAPPKDFKGRRLRPSKPTKHRPGYYELPIKTLRESAKELVRHDRVVKAAKLALGIELGISFDDGGRPPVSEWDVDQLMTSAIADALTDMARHPAELQLDTDGYYSLPAEKKELVEKVIAKVEKMRAQDPPEFVRVRERPAALDETGEVFYEAVMILAESHEDDPFRPRVLR